MRLTHSKRFALELKRIADRQKRGTFASLNEPSIWTEPDFSPRQLLEHLQKNPIGQLLQLIASLPEVRYDKIEKARRELNMTDQQLDERLEKALDRVLEELGI